MKPTLIFSAADALAASHLANHHIVARTPIGVACDVCRRLLDVHAWASPCPGAPEAAR